MAKINLVKSQGFTIVEVMIVLAIAALIILSIFWALPAFQRGSRNSQRDADAQRVVSAVTDCLSNNGGIIANCLSPSGCSLPVSSATNPPCGPFFTGNKYLDMSRLQQITSVVFYNTTTAVIPAGVNTIAVYSGNTCNGNSPASGNTNQFVVLYNREGGGSPAPICTTP